MDWLHVSIDTLARRLQEEKHQSFAESFELHREQGKIAVRRNLFKLSEKYPDKQRENEGAKTLTFPNRLGRNIPTRNLTLYDGTSDGTRAARIGKGPCLYEVEMDNKSASAHYPSDYRRRPRACYA